MNKLLNIISICILIAIPINAFSSPYSDEDIYWLSKNIYFESRGESFYGQVMVGIVTLERLTNGRWGNSIKRVVNSKNQFSWVNDNISNTPKNKKEWEKAKKVALFTLIIYDEKESLGITHYHNDNVYPYWAKKMKKVLVVGRHTFYIE